MREILNVFKYRVSFLIYNLFISSNVIRNKEILLLIRVIGIG